MTGLDRMRRAVAFSPIDRVPVAPLLGAHALHLARVPFDLACRSAEAQSRALIHGFEAYRPDAVFTLMDLSAEPEALGAEVDFRGSRTPLISRHLPVAALLTEEVDSMVLTGRVSVFTEVVARLRERLDERVFVGALISGPLTAAANAVGIEALARMLRRNRELVGRALERLTSACARVASSHLAAGAHGILVLEPCATSNILGPSDLEALLLPGLRALSQHLRCERAVAMLHVCGNCRASVPLLAESGFDVLSLDAPVDLAWARSVVGDRAALMGNLDVRSLLPRGTPESVREAARGLVERLGAGSGFLLSGGCELPPETPPANIRQLLAPQQ